MFLAWREPGIRTGPGLPRFSVQRRDRLQHLDPARGGRRAGDLERSLQMPDLRRGQLLLKLVAGSGQRQQPDAAVLRRRHDRDQPALDQLAQRPVRRLLRDAQLRAAP